jgi:hypothetical protein
VKYTNLVLRKPDFEEIEKLGREAGILNGSAHFEDYTDASSPAARSGPFSARLLLQLSAGNRG